MDETYSPNYAEYTYEKKAEGKMRILKYLLIVGYVLFVALYFLICYITRLIPLFALCPLITWIMVYFTWHYVSYDVYYTFEHGVMEFGKVKKRKKERVRIPVIKLRTQEALAVMPYRTALESADLKNVRHIHDFSHKLSSENLIAIIYQTDKGNEAVIFESIPNLPRLLKKYSENAEGLQLN